MTLSLNCCLSATSPTTLLESLLLMLVGLGGGGLPRDIIRGGHVRSRGPILWAIGGGRSERVAARHAITGHHAVVVIAVRGARGRDRALVNQVTPTRRNSGQNRSLRERSGGEQQVVAGRDVGIDEIEAMPLCQLVVRHQLHIQIVSHFEQEFQACTRYVLGR